MAFCILYSAVWLHSTNILLFFLLFYALCIWNVCERSVVVYCVLCSTAAALVVVVTVLFCLVFVCSVCFGFLLSDFVVTDFPLATTKLLLLSWACIIKSAYYIVNSSIVSLYRCNTLWLNFRFRTLSVSLRFSILRALCVSHYLSLYLFLRICWNFHVKCSSLFDSNVRLGWCD